MLKKYIDKIERVPKGIRKIQGEELYLYGNSVFALNMLNRMKKYQIEIKGVLVSKEYFADNKFENYPVYVANEYLDNCKKPINIVAGFRAHVHKDLVNSLSANHNVDKIYILDGCGYLFSNNFEFPDSPICLIDSYYEGLISRNLCMEYYQNNYDSFLQTYEWLEDEKSRKTMAAYLSGHIELTEFPMLDVWKQDDVSKQYFPEDIIHLSNQEVFIDCGAYIGDTLEIFKSKVENYERYYALEPDCRRFSKLNLQINSEKIVHIPLGAWEKKDRLNFSTDNECGEIDNTTDKDNYIEVDAIDHLIPKDKKVSFIKMDIEGAELKALYGAREIIMRDRPKLAICVYHKREDLITIPQYIKGIVPAYKFYLRAHFPYASEVVLYGIC